MPAVDRPNAVPAPAGTTTPEGAVPMTTVHADPATGGARLRSLLIELQRDVPGVRGCLLATADGLPLADTFEGGEQLASAAAMIAATLGLGQRLAELVGDGRLQDATIRSSSGYVVVYAVGEVGVLTVLTRSGVNVARVHLTARAIVPELVARLS
jgi:predicted regulator of Ras-like GTPase activity (Roadblock/LC7/MglB family)